MTRVFSDGGSTGAARYAALSAAAARHSKTARECAVGKGVDRHLYALQQWAHRLGVAPTPGIFTDEGYRVFKDIRLSTSTLESPALEGGGFGPVSRTSYGVGYGIEERGAHFHVMTYRYGAAVAFAVPACSRTSAAHGSALSVHAMYGSVAVLGARVVYGCSGPTVDNAGFVTAVESALRDIQAAISAVKPATPTESKVDSATAASAP
jgi:hypothetical protein